MFCDFATIFACLAEFNGFLPSLSFQEPCSYCQIMAGRQLIWRCYHRILPAILLWTRCLLLHCRKISGYELQISDTKIIVLVNFVKRKNYGLFMHLLMLVLKVVHYAAFHCFLVSLARFYLQSSHHVNCSGIFFFIHGLKPYKTIDYSSDGLICI